MSREFHVWTRQTRQNTGLIMLQVKLQKVMVIAVGALQIFMVMPKLYVDIVLVSYTRRV